MRKTIWPRCGVGTKVITGLTAWGRCVVDYCWRWPPPKGLQWAAAGAATGLILALFWPYILIAAIGLGLCNLWERGIRK